MPRSIRIELTDTSKTLVEWAEFFSNLRREYPDTAVLDFEIDSGGRMDDTIVAILTLDKSVGNDVSIPGDVTLSVSDVVIRAESDLR